MTQFYKSLYRFHLERVMLMGPDFACVEWLMNAGATSILLSDGTELNTQKQMRQFLSHQGFDVRMNIEKEAPSAHLVTNFNLKSRTFPISDIAYNERWRHISPIYIKEVDATDAVITDQGFKYFSECRNIEKLMLNFNDYFGDDALKELSQGRLIRSLEHLEICFNPSVTDNIAFILKQFSSLQRLHMYFLPSVIKRTAVIRQLKSSLPRCNVTFPELYFIGMGYETDTEKLAFEKFMKTKGGKFQQWLNSAESLPDTLLRFLSLRKR